MKLSQLREQQIQLLAQRLSALEKIRRGLHYTLSRVRMPLNSTENLDDAALEVLAALNERFGKLQDTLAATMKQVALLQAESAEPFVQVLSFMEKVGVIEARSQWQNLRLLRNIGAHEYDIDPVAQAQYFEAITQSIPMLKHMANRLMTYCQTNLPDATPLAQQ